MNAKEQAEAILKLQKEIVKQLENQKATVDQTAGVTAKTRRGLQDQINLFKEMIDIYANRGGLTEQQAKLVNDHREQLKLMGKMQESLVASYTASGKILGVLKQQGTESMNFVNTQAAIYNYSEQIAHQYRDIARDVGLSRDQAHILGMSFRAALPEVLAMGAEMEDVTSIYSNFMEETGRLRFMDEEDLTIITSISKATKMLPSDAAKMAESFDLMGMSTNKMNETLIEVYDASQKAGLNSTKVIKTLQANIKQMSTFSFVNGVKGMTEMARQAVKMRLDVSDVLGMADKFYQPEAALEAAANLQMLGGDIAKAFGDPFETMYLARNKPEELAKRLQDMTENMLQFNAATGEYELPAEARMQLKAAGDQLGIDVNKMTELARQSSKIKDVKMDIDGNVFDDDVREGIAGMAKMGEGGKWQVDFKDEKGKPLTIDLDNTEELREAVDRGLLDQTKSDTDLFHEIALNTQTMTERMKNMGQATRASVTQAIDYHQIYEDAMGEEVARMELAVQKQVSSAMETTGTITSRAMKATSELKDMIKNIGINPNSVIIMPGGGNIPGGGRGQKGNIPTPGDIEVPADLSKLVSAATTSEIKVGGNLNINVTGNEKLICALTPTMTNQIKNLIVNHISMESGGVSSGKEVIDTIQLTGEGVC